MESMDEPTHGAPSLSSLIDCYRESGAPVPFLAALVMNSCSPKKGTVEPSVEKAPIVVCYEDPERNPFLFPDDRKKKMRVDRGYVLAAITVNPCNPRDAK
jgi:hypothetical protein